MIETDAMHAQTKQAALHDATYEGLTRWLSTLVDVRRSSSEGLASDLADVYAGSQRCRALIDRLATVDRARPEEMADMLVELEVELGHIAAHIRSCRPRLSRLATDLYPDD